MLGTRAGRPSKSTSSPEWSLSASDTTTPSRQRQAAQACIRRLSSSLMIVSANVGTTSQTTCSTTSRDSESTASTCALLRPRPPSLPAKSAGKAAAAVDVVTGFGITGTGSGANSTTGALAMTGRATGGGAGDAGMFGVGVEP